mgnify:CR=1 FL=1
MEAWCDIERNLNRPLLPGASPQDNEDRIANVLCPLLAGHDLLLDLHGRAHAVLVVVTHSAALAERFPDRRRLAAGRLEPL